jgi:predicted RNA-binding Zn-ribbon protein involved in translation (DUF1610 family)
MSRKKRSIIWSIPFSEFNDLVKKSKNISDILRSLGLSNKGGNSNTLKQRIFSENIDMSHIKLGRGSNLGKRFHNIKRVSDEEAFSVNSNFNRHSLKKRIVKQNLLPYICKDCGQKDIWNGKVLTLQLEHKNGISNDNRLENLCFLCPNCHSQTPTFAGKSRSKKTKNSGTTT